MQITRRKTRQVKVGDVKIGGNAPIAIQSMAKTDTEDVRATIKQIKELEDAGCEIVRVAVPTIEAAYVIKDIKRKIKIPLVADIHFNYKFALEAIKQGADYIVCGRPIIEAKDPLHAAKEIIKECKTRN